MNVRSWHSLQGVVVQKHGTFVEEIVDRVGISGGCYEQGKLSVERLRSSAGSMGGWLGMNRGLTFWNDSFRCTFSCFLARNLSIKRGFDRFPAVVSLAPAIALCSIGFTSGVSSSRLSIAAFRASSLT